MSSLEVELKELIEQYRKEGFKEKYIKQALERILSGLNGKGQELDPKGELDT